MRLLLLNGDIESALNYFVIASTESYNSLFTDLGPDNIITIFSGLTTLGIQSSIGQTIYCGVIREENGERYSYPVTFVKDENGLWKILGF